MTDSTHGGVLKNFPRTFSIKNWPFMVLLMILAGIPATFFWLDGNPKAALYVFAGVVGVAFIFPLVQVGLELFGAESIAAIHEQGIVVRRLTQESFVPWAQVQSLETRLVTSYTNGGSVTVRVVDVKVAGLPTAVRLTPLHGDAAQLIAAKARLQIVQA